MIISRTPYRISFFGGGTDYPNWYRQHGGAVLATSIDKYCYLTCRYLPPFFEHRIRVVYRQIETCSTIDEISHPVVRESLRYLGITRGVEIHHDGDLPARSGMGSSSAFTVGLLHAIHALHGQMPTKHQLVREAIHLEQEILKETVGSQDQTLAAYGGLRHVRFQPDGTIEVSPLVLSAARLAELRSNLMLVYTGITRTAAEVALSYVPELETRRRQLRIMKQMVDEAIEILTGGVNLIAFGELLHEAWLAKRSLSHMVSNGEIDDLYETALAAGAIGGKLTGAGGGGFLLLFVPPERQPHVLDALDGCIHVPFEFESNGSQIIFYEPTAVHEEPDRLKRPRRKFKELTHPATKPVEVV